MKQLQTTGIVLKRTLYGEADRILTLLTPEHGKISLMAKGVRKPKSKLAGGIELFSVSDISYIQGKSELGTLVSCRLKIHYGHIVNSIDRVQLGYDLIKMLHKSTEDQPEPEYFLLLEHAFSALDDNSISLELIRAWFQAQLLKQAGHQPNLLTDTKGQKLMADKSYIFDYDAMAFAYKDDGNFQANQIKSFRLLFSRNNPISLKQVRDLNNSMAEVLPYLRNMSKYHLQLQ
jgi:DNA repair protein RecO